MPTYGKKLLDNNGNVILPKTRSNLVYHGSTLLSTYLDNIVNGSVTVGNANKLIGREAVVSNGAWHLKATTDGSIVPYSRASSDKNGNEISSTYVSKTGQSTINGGDINGNSVFTLNSTGNEGSIKYFNNTSKGWVAGVGCGGSGNFFTIWSFDASTNLLTIDTNGHVATNPSKNFTNWCVRNCITTDSAWSTVPSNRYWFIRA